MTNTVISNDVAAIDTKANQTAKALSNKAKAAQAKANKARQAALSAKVKAEKAEKAERAKALKEKAAHAAEQKKLAALPIHTLRMEAAKAASASYGAAKRYAYKLTLVFGEGWTEIPLSGPASDNEISARNAIKAEKAAYQADCKSKGHSNPSKAWGDVLRHAKDNNKGEKVVRGPLTRIMETGGKLYKDMYNNWEAMTPEQREAFELMKRVCQLMNIDYRKLEG